MSTIQNLRKSLVRNWRPVCSLVGDAPFPYPLPPASGGGWASPPPASSSLELLRPFVLRTASSVFRPVNFLSARHPFCPHLLVADAGVWGTFLLGVAFRHVICGFYLFVLPVRLPSKIQKLPPDPPVRGFPGVWKFPLLRLPSQDGSLSLALLCLFLSFIFCPTSFRRQWAAFLGV